MRSYDTAKFIFDIRVGDGGQPEVSAASTAVPQRRLDENLVNKKSNECLLQVKLTDFVQALKYPRDSQIVVRRPTQIEIAQ